MKQEKTSKLPVDSERSAEAVIRYLTKRGILEEKKISTEKLQDAKAQRMSDAYHNTLLLLKHYRTLSWLMECFPDTIAEELDQPYEALDKLIDRLLIAGMVLFVLAHIGCAVQLSRIDREINDIQTSLNVMDKRAYIYGNWDSVEEYQGVLG